MPSEVTNLLALLSFVLLLLFIFKFQRKSLVLLFLFVELILGCFDVMRLQPFWFLCFLVFLIYLLDNEKTFHYLYFIFAATYFFAGLHKLNLVFINDVWVYSILYKSIGLKFELANSIPIKTIGFIIPILEMALAILMFTKLRIRALRLLILMHLLIISWLIYINHNLVVIPWNLMMIFTLLYFINQPFISLKKSTSKKTGKLIIILVILLPSLSIFDFYYPYFSAKVYTGRKHILIATTEKSAFKKYEKHRFKRMFHSHEGYIVSLENYSIKNLKVPIPPSKWVQKKLVKKLREADSFIDFYSIDYPYKTYSRID